jgi:hypothetical protein
MIIPSIEPSIGGIIIFQTVSILKTQETPDPSYLKEEAWVGRGGKKILSSDGRSGFNKIA